MSHKIKDQSGLKSAIYLSLMFGARTELRLAVERDNGFCFRSQSKLFKRPQIVLTASKSYQLEPHAVRRKALDECFSRYSRDGWHNSQTKKGGVVSDFEGALLSSCHIRNRKISSKSVPKNTSEYISRMQSPALHSPYVAAAPALANKSQHALNDATPPAVSPGDGSSKVSSSITTLTQLIASFQGTGNTNTTTVNAVNGSTLVRGFMVYQLNPAPTTALSALISPPLSVGDMAGMVTSKGFGLEEHDVITSDGYIIVNFRIPRSSGSVSAPPGPPVLLLHGISLSSTCWVINQPDQSLAFILADKGYDVWMSNTRGNTFSKASVQYSNQQSKFWAFSADEMALIDLPATIDYILQVTGYQQVAFVGHSQGASLMLMLLARKPQYNSLVSINLSLAPVVFAKYIKSQIMVSFFKLANTSAAASLLPPQQFFFMSPVVQALFLNGACQLPVEVSTCILATQAMFGPSTHITVQQYMRYWQAWPSPTSYWNALQWAQMYNEPTPRFFKFNYGPEYELQQVLTPTMLFSGGKDVLSTPLDINLTSKYLRKSGALLMHNTIDGYSHMDFIWDSTGANSLVYSHILVALNSYTPQQAIIISSQGPPL
ncbi:hypothetical protein CEUSTIGMA_g3817.t1 [Chlamydomonas eustigma]|uniref:AB hydrolase-1 domain-containing protein n=1 Tax=Chlamydomonas eustigma TaxID=1157962 RepID=A0A250WZW2_9CHLO|nr:hypothetical protein CEUSTIGMA_g3817.t1 [Chlamydomonas eustigma]|eukprot:GAX76371.1 hypothetical protein CEUSTIGMA_g3817.t1 [Chlamydomonas eustigma]